MSKNAHMRCSTSTQHSREYQPTWFCTPDEGAEWPCRMYGLCGIVHSMEAYLVQSGYHKLCKTWMGLCHCHSHFCIRKTGWLVQRDLHNKHKFLSNSITIPGTVAICTDFMTLKAFAGQQTFSEARCWYTATCGQCCDALSTSVCAGVCGAVKGNVMEWPRVRCSYDYF